jgi:hypothetical protein
MRLCRNDRVYFDSEGFAGTGPSQSLDVYPEAVCPHGGRATAVPGTLHFIGRSPRTTATDRDDSRSGPKTAPICLSMSSPAGRRARSSRMWHLGRVPVGPVILRASRRALLALDESHDFFAGSEVALRNLRWQMLGFTAAYPEATQNDVSATFATLSGTSGSNAFNLVLRRDWESVSELSAQVRLTSIVAIYEGWAHASAIELGLTSDADVKTWNIFVQPWEPSRTPAAVPRVLGLPVPELREVADACRLNRLNKTSDLRDLLFCFRAFKEVRNSLAHAESRATDRTENRYQRYARLIPTWSATGTAPTLPSVVEGHTLTIAPLRFGDLSAVIRSLIVTFDGLVSDRRPALDATVAHWVNRYGRGVTLPADPARATRSFLSRWGRAQLPVPSNGALLLAEIRKRGVILF